MKKYSLISICLAAMMGQGCMGTTGGLRNGDALSLDTNGLASYVKKERKFLYSVRGGVTLADEDDELLDDDTVQDEEAPPSEVTLDLMYKLGSDPIGSKGMEELFIDAWTRSIRKEGQFDIPIVMNAHVKKIMSYFQNEIPDLFAIYLIRSKKYIPLMQKILKEKEMPVDLVYIAFIESGFNTHAYSRSRASGPWQFISSTGRLYGLKINWWVDERRDPVKSTRAAASYLKDLYGQFGSWYLAAAGYNAGEGKIERAIRKHKTDDFWELIRFRYLKRETKQYVPKLIAAAIIAKNPEKYGFSDLNGEDPFRFDTVVLKNAASLASIAKACETDIETIKELNPELKRNCTPPGIENYELRIPYKTTEKFEKNMELLAQPENIKYVKHKKRKGETLYTISRRYNSDVDAIMDLNNIINPRRVRNGSLLLVPVSKREAPAARTQARQKVAPQEKAGTEENPAAVTATVDQAGVTVYEVQSGDTLWNIAQKMGVDLKKLMKWNKLTRRSKIRPGDEIRIYAENTNTNPN